MSQQMKQMQEVLVERLPMGESAGAAQFSGAYAVPPLQSALSGYDQHPPQMPPMPSSLWQQTMASEPAVMPVPQTVVPPHRRLASVTKPASNSAAMSNVTPRPAACFRCRQRGHIRRDCPMAGAVPRPVASQAAASPDRVQMASDGKKLQDVYVPIQLFGHGAVALMDSGAETTIIGARLLPDGVKIRPTTRTLLAANGMLVPFEGEYNVHFWVAGRKFNICAVVTKSVHEFILGIDFLSKNVSAWDFGTGHVRVRNLWV